MNTNQLKWTALILMVIDHIGYYFPDSPIWLRWLGRGSYPLFLICMVWGYHYTRNRRISVVLYQPVFGGNGGMGSCSSGIHGYGTAVDPELQ